MGNKNHITIEPIRNAYLSKRETNLLIVDWESGARQNYDKSRALVPQVAKRVAKRLKQFFRSLNILPSTVHILGHSLGAHISCNVGRHFGGQIGRITALDPAGPLFLKSAPDACNKNDAQFVDAIHTDVGVLGEAATRGHIDFYPNRGFPPQPGCYMLDILTACEFINGSDKLELHNENISDIYSLLQSLSRTPSVRGINTIAPTVSGRRVQQR